MTRILIPTYRRVHRLRTADFLPKAESLITLVVRPEEKKAYEQLGYDVAVLPKSVKDIAMTRDHVGRIAAAMGLDWFAMADDDLRVLSRDSEYKLTPLADGRKLMKAFAKGLKTASSVALSPRFMNNTVKEDILYIKPQSQFTAYRTADYRQLKFGQAKYFEDVERTLQLLSAGKQTAMLYSYAIDIGPMNYDGGMAEWREYAAMQAEAEDMERRWPGIVKACKAADDKFWPGLPELERPHIKMQWRKAYANRNSE
jgi:hypothetical protein